MCFARLEPESPMRQRDARVDGLAAGRAVRTKATDTTTDWPVGGRGAERAPHRRVKGEEATHV